MKLGCRRSTSFITGTPFMSSATSSVPRDAAALEALLRAQGVEKFESQVLNQLLELQHRALRACTHCCQTKSLPSYLFTQCSNCCAPSICTLHTGMVTELVEDARDYADHADRDDIQPADLALVVQNHVNFQSAQPPPREVHA